MMTTDDYSEAYESGYQRTIRFLLSRGLNPAKAEESAQAAWSAGWEKRSQLQKPKRVVQWVNTIALNIFRERFRKSVEEELPLQDPPAKHGNLISRIDLARAVEKFPKVEWNLLSAHYAFGLTSGEIGDILQQNPVTIRVRVLRAKKKLRRQLHVTA